MRKVISSFILFLVVFSSKGQNVGIGTASPHPSAALDISSSTSGFLPPRMTNTERNGINNPTAGLMIYNTTTDCLEIFGKGKWNPVYCVPADTTAGNDSTTVTDIDGNTYPTVKICDQTWMAKNLDVARYRNGDPIPQVTDPTQWANLTTGAWCWYNNDSATYGSVYGRLYNWYAVNDTRGLAPQGWHVPSDGEWNILVKCLDPNADTSCGDCFQSNTAGGKLKEAGTIHWTSLNLDANNVTGFTLLPGGVRNPSISIGNSFEYILLNSLLWTSTPTLEINTTNAFERNFSYSNTGIYNQYCGKKWGLSVRCIKDTPITTLNNGLVAYYPFSGNAGDSSGNGNHGTVNGGVTQTTDRFGFQNKAYFFDGTTGYIDVSSLNNLTYKPISYSAWVIINSYFPFSFGHKFRTIIGRNTQFVGDNGAIGFYADNNVNNGNYDNTFLMWRGGSVTGDIPYSATQPPLNSWCHIVYTQEINGDWKWYINGQLTNNGNFTDSQADYNFFRIGSCNNSSGYFWNDKLDDIRIYNRALTQAEITYLATH
jgi:uncharacterized protein (TIGR02145 family)